jgi:CheY-like chemotaxis protein
MAKLGSKVLMAKALNSIAQYRFSIMKHYLSSNIFWIVVLFAKLLAGTCLLPAQDSVHWLSDDESVVDETIRIGVLANRGKAICLQEWGPTATYLSQQLAPLSFSIIPLDFEQIIPAVRKGEVDFVAANPSYYAYLEYFGLVRRIVTLQMPTASTPQSRFGGVILTLAGRNDINEITDLRGKRFAAVSEKSLGRMDGVAGAVKESCLLRFSVTDSGIGIPAEKCEKLFQQFSQLDASTTRKHGGTGLGLAICKQLTEMMGGQIGVHSPPERAIADSSANGSEFWFTARFDLQACQLATRGNPDPQSLPTSHSANAAIPDFSHYRARILLAEDNMTNQVVALGVLKKLGLTADLVSNGFEAIEALKRTSYDLVLMDVQMPVMDGLEATRSIRNPLSANRNGMSIPIIAMTAHAMDSDRHKCIEAGMNDYLAKPFSLRALAEVLHRWLPEVKR